MQYRLTKKEVFLRSKISYGFKQPHKGSINRKNKTNKKTNQWINQWTWLILKKINRVSPFGTMAQNNLPNHNFPFCQMKLEIWCNMKLNNTDTTKPRSKYAFGCYLLGKAINTLFPALCSIVKYLRRKCLVSNIQRYLTEKWLNDYFIFYGLSHLYWLFKARQNFRL